MRLADDSRPGKLPADAHGDTFMLLTNTSSDQDERTKRRTCTCISLLAQCNWISNEIKKSTTPRLTAHVTTSCLSAGWNIGQ